jgi:hypothetical protein
MPKQYRIQRGTINGRYETCYETNSRPAAWRAYKETGTPPGYKKRLQSFVMKARQTFATSYNIGIYRTVKTDRMNAFCNPELGVAYDQN